jgi:2-haloacid dehalogenase
VRYVSFDCYGTLIDFQIDRTLRDVFGDRLPPEIAGAFCTTAAAYRFDEVLGPYSAYREVIARSTRRTADRYGIEYRPDDGRHIFEAIPTYQPFTDVNAGLRALAERFPLVILSNAEEEQMTQTVRHLDAPFHAVLTAERARAYKPRVAAFEYMLRELGCQAEDIIHVSASPQYDLRPARDLGIGTRVLVNRDAEPAQPWLGYQEIRDLSQLPALLSGGVSPYEE